MPDNAEAPAGSPLSPETLWSDDDYRLERSAVGTALFCRGSVVFKSWADFPDDAEPPTDALLFMRSGVLVLRNAHGEVFMPEARLTTEQRRVLAEVLSMRLQRPAAD